jgi:carbonic anhydrase/acetyltransferase-like protein (isoleucine patch superfamily)
MSSSNPPPITALSTPRTDEQPPAPIPSSVIPASKPSLDIHPTAHLDPQAYIQGTFPITLAANVVIHPRARLVSVHGPLVIGAGTVVPERCVIGGPGPDPREPLPTPPEAPLKTVLGQKVLLHASAEIQAGAVLEDACLVEPRAVIKKGVNIGKHSKVCASCMVDRSVGDWMVVWGTGQARRMRIGAVEAENGRLKALERERDATAGLLKAAQAKAMMGKRRG